MPITIDPDAFYSQEEAEPILRKTKKTQNKDRCLGNGPPFIKMSKNAIFYRGSDLLALMEERTVKSGPEYRNKFVKTDQ